MFETEQTSAWYLHLALTWSTTYRAEGFPDLRLCPLQANDSKCPGAQEKKKKKRKKKEVEVSKKNIVAPEA